MNQYTTCVNEAASVNMNAKVTKMSNHKMPFNCFGTNKKINFFSVIEKKSQNNKIGFSLETTQIQIQIQFNYFFSFSRLIDGTNLVNEMKNLTIHVSLLTFQQLQIFIV